MRAEYIMSSDHQNPRTEYPDWIVDGERCTKVGSSCYLNDLCITCSFNPEMKKNYITNVIPDRVKKCFKNNYKSDSCKYCSREKDCKLLDENRELLK